VGSLSVHVALQSVLLGEEKLKLPGAVPAAASLQLGLPGSVGASADAEGGGRSLGLKSGSLLSVDAISELQQACRGAAAAAEVRRGAR
jgi:hypothetical protein